MNALYPYTYPIILSDVIFTLYGGHTGTSTSGQRTAAYFIAEKAASYDIGTFLKPTTVTGTYYGYIDTIVTDWAYINSINAIRFLDKDGNIYYTATSPVNNYSLRDDTYGIIDIHSIYSYCNCISTVGYPYQVEVIYTAGLPTGTSLQADVLLALTIYSDIVLNEIIGYGNESPGDIGIRAYSNQQYSETRVAMLRTAYGTSARANFAYGILKGLRKYRFVGL